VKRGDLVKYSQTLSGLEKCVGVIVELDGLAMVVQWFDRQPRWGSKFVPGSEKSVELPEFLEVISEAR